MTRIALQRVTAEHAGFRALIAELDAELRARYGEVQAAFDAFNGVRGIETALVLSDTTGWVACGCFRAVDATTVELKRMYVKPDRRGKQLALEIIRGLEAWAVELGYARMILEHGPLQPEATALYTRAGFTPIPRFPPYVDMEISICLGKDL